MPLFSRRSSMDADAANLLSPRAPLAEMPPTPSDNSDGCKLFLDSDLEDSTEHLLQQREPDAKNAIRHSANLSGSAESLDRLLTDELTMIERNHDYRHDHDYPHDSDHAHCHHDSDRDSLTGSLTSPELSLPSPVYKAPSSRSLSSKSQLDSRTSSSGQSMTERSNSLSNSSTLGDLTCNGYGPQYNQHCAQKSKSLELMNGSMNGAVRSRPSVKHPVTERTTSLPLEKTRGRGFLPGDGLLLRNAGESEPMRAAPGERVNNYYVTALENDGPVITVSDHSDARLPNGFGNHYQTSMV